MKFCPKCSSQYADDTLSFCLEDGTPLAVFGPGDMPTAVLSESELLTSVRAAKPAHDPRFMDSQVTRPAVASPAQGPVAAGTKVTLTSVSQTLPGAKIYYTTDGTDPRGQTPGPLLSPAAKEYTGPLTLATATKLFVRVYNPTPVAPVGSGFSAPTRLDYTVQ